MGDLGPLFMKRTEILLNTAVAPEDTPIKQIGSFSGLKDILQIDLGPCLRQSISSLSTPVRFQHALLRES